MDDTADAAPQLPDVYVVDRNQDPRYRELCTLFRWFDGTQHDYCYADFMGRSRPGFCCYGGGGHRDKGMVWPSEAPRVSWDIRRPNAPAGLARQVISRFTELTMGTPPTLTCPADDDTAAYLTAVFEESCTWDAHQEARDYAGACGSAVMILTVTEGQPNAEALPSFAVDVLRWANRKRWIPAEVIQQYRVEIMTTGPNPRPEIKIRTILWTEQERIEFEDVPSDWPREKPLVVKESEQHFAGRCPVVWVQNIRRTRDPEGEYDLLNQANLEMCDEVDKVQSHALKATKANTQPTLVRMDDAMSFMQQFPRLAKGSGTEIRVGKGGDAKYLETTGDSVKMGWDSAEKMKDQVLKNVNCYMPESEQITQAPSGVAVAKLRRGMETRGNRIRTAQSWVIRQSAQIWIALGMKFPPSSEDDPKDKSIVLPPRCYKIDPPEPAEAPEPPEPGELPEPEEVAAPPVPPPLEPKERLGPHKVGKARSVKVGWPPYDHPTPQDIKALAEGLTTATADKVLSRQTATEVLVTAIRVHDPEEEMRRLSDEKAQNQMDLGPLLGAPTSGAAKAAETGALARGSSSTGEEPTADGDGDGILSE